MVNVYINRGGDMKKFRKKQLQAKKRSWRTWCALLLASLAAAAGFFAMTPGPTREAIAAVLADPLDLLALRSPGQRSSGALIQTKAARGVPRIPANRIPKERVLSNVRWRPFIDLPTNFPSLDLTVALPAESFFNPLVPANGLNFGPPLLITPLFGPFFGGGSGSSGGVPVSSVPEPSQWLMMLVGFFSIGSALRAARRKGRPPAQVR